MEPILIVHGGAGDLTVDRIPGRIMGVKNSVRNGFKVLKNGGSVLDAVEEAIKTMELDPNMNAGYGSVLNIEGYVEMEASIMNGKDLNAGCTTLIRDIMHPISLARQIMERTNHTFIGSDRAIEFARKENFEILPEGSLICENAKCALDECKDKLSKGIDMFALTKLGNHLPDEGGTVGAVAIDSEGNIAAGTSTGGITGKAAGRIADTSVLGSGTYADNQIGGVSSTGHGEIVMRFNLAQRILQKLHYQGVSAQEATESMAKEMTERLIGTGGAITIDKTGDIGVYFTSKRMSWAYIKGTTLHYGIEAGEDHVEDANL